LIETLETNHGVPVFVRDYLIPDLIRKFEVELIFAFACAAY
jgi:hypothetical protein